MIRLRLISALAILVALSLPILPPPHAFAQPQDGATMTVLQGQVAVVRPDGSAVQPAPSGTVVRAGDEIRTLTRTGALITFFAGTEIEMGEDTVLVVERVTRSGATVDISLKQVLGVTLNRVQTLTDPTSAYRIDAGGATAVVRGTTFLLIGPVATSQGNISALICLDDCDGRTTFAGCPVAPYTAFGVTVERNRVTSGCEVAAVDRDADYFNAGFEAITTFEQAFAGASGDTNPGTTNLGREEGQRRADQRRREKEEDDGDNRGVPLNPCQPRGVTPSPGTSPQLFPVGGSVTEGNSGTTTLNAQVFLLPASSSTVTVNYATSGGTATPGTDFTSVSGTLTFTPGTTVQTIAIPVIGDTTPEPTEIIQINLSGASGAPLAFPHGLGQIVDDDGPIEVAVVGDSVFEGNAGTTSLEFDVLLSRPATSNVTVDYTTTAGGTATPGTDFTPTSGTVTIPAGETTGTFAVQIIGDTAVEPDETVLAQISNASTGTILGGIASGTIIDDDGPPTVAVFDEFVVEGCDGTTPATFLVGLSRPATTPVTVSFTTANGSATAGSDYTATSGTLTFAPGETTREVTVEVLGDANVEPDETFFVNLTNASGAGISQAQATGTILNDD